MTGLLYVDSHKLGAVDFNVTDESMGGIGGIMKPLPDYELYREQIQDLSDTKGIANADDLNFRIVLEGDILLKPLGGIGVTHSRDFDEIYVESAGIESEIIEKINAS
jgi:hypothetical protein